MELIPLQSSGYTSDTMIDFATHLFTSLAVCPLGNLEVVGIAALGSSLNILLEAVTDSSSADLRELEVTVQDESK
jgi:hypothetical protein